MKNRMKITSVWISFLSLLFPIARFFLCLIANICIDTNNKHHKWSDNLRHKQQLFHHHHTPLFMINVLWIIVIVVIVYFISHLRSLLMENDYNSREKNLKIEFMVDQNSVYIRNSSLLSRILAKLGHSTSSLAISSSSSNASKQISLYFYQRSECGIKFVLYNFYSLCQHVLIQCQRKLKHKMQFV